MTVNEEASPSALGRGHFVSLFFKYSWRRPGCGRGVRQSKHLDKAIGLSSPIERPLISGQQVGHRPPKPPVDYLFRRLFLLPSKSNPSISHPFVTHQIRCHPFKGHAGANKWNRNDRQGTSREVGGRA